MITDKLNTIAENEQKVYDAGAKSEYDKFWDSLQNKGSRVNYDNAFLGWTKEGFKPKYNMTPTNSAKMFMECDINADLVEILNECGVTLDTSDSTDMLYMFMRSKFTRLGVIDISKYLTASRIFSWNTSLHTIDKLILRQDNKFNAMFEGMYALTNLTIEGTIGQNGFNVQWSTRLTHDSLMSIINALADYSENASGGPWKITLGDSNIPKLSKEELDMILAKGWEYA